MDRDKQREILDRKLARSRAATVADRDLFAAQEASNNRKWYLFTDSLMYITLLLVGTALWLLSSDIFSTLLAKGQANEEGIKVIRYSVYALSFLGWLSIFVGIYNYLIDYNHLNRYKNECKREDWLMKSYRMRKEQEKEDKRLELTFAENSRRKEQLEKEKHEKLEREERAQREIERSKIEREEQIRLNLSEAEKNKQEQETLKLQIAAQEKELELERLKASSKAAEAQIVATHQERIQQSDKELDKLLDLAKSLGINKNG